LVQIQAQLPIFSRGYEIFVTHFSFYSTATLPKPTFCSFYG
jgi:hypothetical protein